MGTNHLSVGYESSQLWVRIVWVRNVRGYETPCKLLAVCRILIRWTFSEFTADELSQHEYQQMCPPENSILERISGAKMKTPDSVNLRKLLCTYLGKSHHKTGPNMALDAGRYYSESWRCFPRSYWLWRHTNQGNLPVSVYLHSVKIVACVANVIYYGSWPRLVTSANQRRKAPNEINKNDNGFFFSGQS